MKKYRIEILVDEEALIAAYTGNDQSVDKEDLPSIEAMIEHECNWLTASGIELIGDIVEVESEN